MAGARWRRGVGVSAGQGGNMRDLVDRRRVEPDALTPADRRRTTPGHDVCVGTSRAQPGWLIGRCSCGEHAEARVEVDGVVEAWVTWHRWNARGSS